MRRGLIALWMLLGSVTSAVAQVSIGIGLPSVSIGINVPVYPELVPVPGYPVYYAPRLSANFFFYDGMYWVYHEDYWYASSWYNGPWALVGPEYVPVFVLRIPVRYYRAPPVYFRGWRADAPPRWGHHWGHEWERQRRGWDRWDRASAPKPAPLPTYQRQYSGDRYPRVEQQPALHGQHYRYQPRNAVVRQHYQERELQRTPAPSQRGQQSAPQESSPRQQEVQRSNPPPRPPQSGPADSRPRPPERRGEDVQRPAPTQAPAQQKGPTFQDQRQQPPPGAAQREQQAPRSSREDFPQGKGTSQEPRREKGPWKGYEKGEGRGQESNR